MTLLVKQKKPQVRLQIADQVRFVHAGCGVYALSGLQNHAKSIHCRVDVGQISAAHQAILLCHQSQLLREPLVIDFLICTVSFNCCQRVIQFSSRALLSGRTAIPGRCRSIADRSLFQSQRPVADWFQPFVYHRCVTKYPINTTIFQIDKGILITVIGDSFHFGC